MSNYFRYIFGNKSSEKKLIASIVNEVDLEKYQKEYIIVRFVDILYDDFDIVAIKNKIAFHVLRFMALTSGVLIPIIANLSENITFLNLNRTALITILGLISSVAFGFLQIYQNERVWLHHREIFEMVRTEGYRFLGLAGEYEACGTHKAAFPKFVNNIEGMIRSDITKYTRLMNKREINVKD